MKSLIPYRLKPEDHPALIVKMGDLYNSTIEHLATKPLNKVGPSAQIDWWHKLDHPRVTCHLYSPAWKPEEIVAFSMVTDRGGYCTPMFAIHKDWWGRGYGVEIIEHYLLVAGKLPLFGEQLKTNEAICYLNKRFGWQIISEEGNVQRLYHPNGNLYPQSVYDEILRYHSEGK